MKRLLFFISLCFTINTLSAQYKSCERWSFGTNFTATLPIGEMFDNNFRTNYGMTFNALYDLTPQARFMTFHVGGRMILGRGIGEKDRIILEDPEGAAARSSISNTLADFHLLGRIVLNSNNKIQQYFDFFGGGRLISSNQDIRLRRPHFDYDRRTSEQLSQSANWAWGTGAGVYIRLNKNAFLDLGINYTHSPMQDFVDLNTVKANDNIVEYDYTNSVSNSVGVHIGFHFTIDCNQRSEQYNDDYDVYERDRVKFKRNRRTPKAKTKSSSKEKN